MTGRAPSTYLCRRCQVTWAARDTADRSCWVCGDPGIDLLAVTVARDARSEPRKQRPTPGRSPSTAKGAFR